MRSLTFRISEACTNKRVYGVLTSKLGIDPLHFLSVQCPLLRLVHGNLCEGNNWRSNEHQGSFPSLFK